MKLLTTLLAFASVAANKIYIENHTFHTLSIDAHGCYGANCEPLDSLWLWMGENRVINTDHSRIELGPITDRSTGAKIERSHKGCTLLFASHDLTDRTVKISTGERGQLVCDIGVS